ncbi:hypothetical protein CRUP_006776 [Coryphaenoides rupestris]|nr:hypothetical protein CRUP_006776 [Coryphaenoides rupestris]
MQKVPLPDINVTVQLSGGTVFSFMTQNVTGMSLLIKGEYLSENTEYQVKVRAIPSLHFEGTWSDWSRTARITRRIHAYMVPSVPATLAPFYRQVKPGVEAMSFKPEQFSHMHIQPMKAAEEASSSGESGAVSAEPSSEDLGDHCLDWDLPAAPDGPGGRRWRSTSDSSTFTGESASTLLSYQSSSADGMYSRPRSRSQSPPTVPRAAEGGRGPSLPGFSGSFGRGDPPEGPEVNLNGPTQPNREADYVTMSSFRQGGPERPRDGD